jgi:hypothetical protein
MVRVLTGLIASGLVFGLTATLGQTLGTGSAKTSGEYQMAKETCTGPGGVGAQPCVKDAKAAEDRSRMGCEKLKDQARRECVLEAFVLQHDRMIAGDRVEKGGGAPSGGPQPK